MEQSYVKLIIAQKEEKLRKEKEKKNMKPVNSTTQKDGKYFLVRLDMEVEKINSLINSAEKDSRLAQLPEEVSGKFRNAIGKAHLLLNKRFKQFRELCRDNLENDPDKKETKSSDLQGYWDMMFIQIEDVHALFIEIDNLRANNWLVTDEADGFGLKPQDDAKKGSSSTPKGKRKSAGKSPRTTKTKSSIDDEKVKREARSRLAAVRKQAKLRAQQEAAANNDGSLDSPLNGSLNGSWAVDKNEEADSSLNNSLNSSSNSSSVELLSNGLDSIDIAAESRPVVLPPPNIEVNGVA